MPESRLKNDVLPAPFGPMIPSSSPSGTSSETSATMVAPPMSSPSERVARIEVELTLSPRRERLRERLDRGLDVAGRDRLDHLRRPLAFPADELDLEHRLDHRVVLRPDPLLALRGEELPPLERRDHLVDIVPVRLLDRVNDHLGRHEPVRREQVRHLLPLRHLLHEPLVDLVLGAVRDVVREQ